MALLSLRDVSVVYHSGGKDVHAINRVSLDVEQGESLGIVGESGSGKTTLIMAVLRLLPPGRAGVTGQALLDGRDLFQMSPQELAAVRWEDMAVVFQKAMNALSPVTYPTSTCSTGPEPPKRRQRRRSSGCWSL